MLRSLLAASLLRLVAPTGGEHCARGGEQAATPTGHAHHGEAPACDHCPPAECATQPACATPLFAAVVMAPLVPSVIERGMASPPSHDATWATRDHPPPVPPPQPLLT